MEQTPEGEGEARRGTLQPGDVITLRKGLHVFHNQGREITVLETPVPAYVVAVRIRNSEKCSCTMIDVRALNSFGEYHAEGALLTFAQSGNFLPEFMQQSLPVLRKIKPGRR